MLSQLGFNTLESLVDSAVPGTIRRTPLKLAPGVGESQALAELRRMSETNIVARSFIGTGYYDTLTPPVIQRNILENPAWYTAYTPYQAEISQGRLEALLNFQTMICELTALDISNASMLDEGTAAAEAMTLCARVHEGQGRRFAVSERCHPQTIDILRTRALPLGIEVELCDLASFTPTPGLVGVLAQYPDTRGDIRDFSSLFEQVHALGGLCVVATDLLALTLLRPPGEFGADVAVGSTQRFGLPMGFGGPHAGFLATKDSFKRQMPGRLVGVSKDATGRPALRLALGTREQHIRREKATSNICTAQVLLAVMSSMYAVYHGPEGLRRIARRIRLLTKLLSKGLRQLGIGHNEGVIFDTLTVQGIKARQIHDAAEARGMNLRRIDETSVGISLDETKSLSDVRELLSLFGPTEAFSGLVAAAEANLARGSSEGDYPPPFARTSPFLGQPVFNSYHCEHEMLRYIRRLEARDLSLCHTMISLGSCTMKLNATTEMLPISWPKWAGLHPFAPSSQVMGYRRLILDLEEWLADITGLSAVSLQPNAGSQGEYSGLQAIRGYHDARGDAVRRICLIPTSAHGTNPASAAMCGMQVVPVACDAQGNIDVADLRAKAAEHASNLAALMVTYPSTHGVFETAIREICEIVHQHGGQVYMDGANMNAQVGLSSPGTIGADVCHLNLHKTFAIPHGGGGPGVGPVCVAAHLAPFLPGHPVVFPRNGRALLPSPEPRRTISAAPWGSASILVIPWLYIRMMGAEGLTDATRYAILNANYVARRLDPFFPVLYKGEKGLVAHECILDFRAWKKHGIEVEDVAKRLMDYGYHAPTMSFPVPGTLMVEPTESESQAELDRFCNALISIHKEMTAIAEGHLDKADNPLKNAPHPAEVVCADTWTHPYSRELAAFPDAHSRAFKFWPSVARVDNVYGDRNLVCSCAGLG